MTEATWGDATKTPDIDWTMSASLEDVVRGGEDIPEVTSLRAAVVAWTTLDPEHRDQATLTPERAILVDGASVSVFHGDAIAALVERLPS